MPKDPMILLSYVNTQLRDHYETLDKMCTVLGEDRTQIEQTLQSIDYEYDADLNRFV